MGDMSGVNVWGCACGEFFGEDGIELPERVLGMLYLGISSGHMVIVANVPDDWMTE